MQLMLMKFTKLSNMGRYLKFLTVINETHTGKVINVAGRSRGEKKRGE